MKILKGFTILVITIILGSCFDPPEFPNTPHIDFVGVVFKEGGGSVNDSLIVTLEFEDGDGDLGVDAAHPYFKSAPFNSIDFHQTDESQKTLTPIGTELLSVDHLNKKNEKVTSLLNVLQIDDPSKGKLVFPRTRKQPGFGSLVPAYHCEYYEDATKSSSFAIEAGDKAVLDATAVVDTLYQRQNTVKVATHYVIRDTLYFQWNKNHFNIDVDFLIKEPSNPEADPDGFVVYNWNRAFCQQDLDGRFPILTDTEGSPLAGTIRYGMPSIGFKKIFTIKTMKLRIRIRDRALNESNTITTGEFTLDSIRIP